MVKTTRKQREALFTVFQRDFPSWTSPTKREASTSHRGETWVVKVPSIQWRRFRAKVKGGPGCIMVHWKGMWLGIEPDGYTHS